LNWGNLISIFRIIFSPIILLFPPFSGLFFIFYSIFCISDIFDGYIARKTNSTTKLGAKLDSIGDIILIIIVAIAILPIINFPIIIWTWIFIILIIRIISVVIAYYKYKRFIILHTTSNKLSGFLIFLFVYLYPFIDTGIILSIICIFITFSAIEELIIHLKSKKLNIDIKGLFF